MVKFGEKKSFRFNSLRPIQQKLEMVISGQFQINCVLLIFKGLKEKFLGHNLYINVAINILKP